MRPWLREKRAVIPLVALLLLVVVSVSRQSAPSAASGKAASVASEVAAAGKALVPQRVAATSRLTMAQANAKRKGESYIEMSGFSRSGLIDQLNYEGFSFSDADRAVRSMNVDWNTEAEQKAKSYLHISAFSRSGLIDQLVYEGFTRAQAAHGADSAGL